MKWYEELGSDCSDIEADCDENHVILDSEHKADSKMSSEVEEETNEFNRERENEEMLEEENSREIEDSDGENDNKKYYYGKNRYKWSSEPATSIRRRRAQENIVGKNAPNMIKKTSPTLKDLDKIELYAFLGLLAFTSLFKSNNESISTLFATNGTGREMIRCIMSKERFAFLLTCLRFDNPEDRIMRRFSDSAAPITEIFELFVKNCQTSYVLGDSGKNSDGNYLSAEDKKYSKPTQAVLYLTKPLYHTNRSVTFDNWFTSIELVKILKEKGLTCIGDDLNSKKPYIITDYNSTKGGVDALDEKCAKFSCNRRTCRWPMAIFYQLFDISTVNAYIMYESYRDNNLLQRSVFLEKLAFQLVTPELEHSSTNPYIQRNLRLTILRILDNPEGENHETKLEKLEKKKNCFLCPYKLKRRTAYLCFNCQKPICLECAKKMCPECTQNT
ncbi:hypothetical protein NQ314_007709 [Rhamnusium bicolor]|uniref:PiggyBac transposable element-derived protein domain-containing protein n=1 Tax=Rhamnusium bicolor TaxID=1586634 RepID=A0AAV8YKT7_9CUCU|nr:hypothetical protein NQ314_007709 [Rhamnusium bicolor]